MAKASALTRSFTFNGKTLADPDPKMNPNQVREFWSRTDAGLLNATVEGPEIKGGKAVYTFRIARGDKG